MSSHTKRTILHFVHIFLVVTLVITSIFIANPNLSFDIRNYAQEKNQINEVSSAAITPIIVPGSLLDTGIKAEAFTDVDHSGWSWKYIQQISPLGIIPPKIPTTFDPQGLVSRLDMARFLLKTYELITKNSPPVVPTTFTDLAELSQLDQTPSQDLWSQSHGRHDLHHFSPRPSQPCADGYFKQSLQIYQRRVPPEVEVPYDIYDPDLDWSVKYIKRPQLKITKVPRRPLSPGQRHPRADGHLIFSFMRLVTLLQQSQHGNRIIRSKIRVLNQQFWIKNTTKMATPPFLTQRSQEHKNRQHCLVCLSLVFLQPQAFFTPPIYNEVQLTNLRNTLNCSKNQWKQLLVNYIGMTYQTWWWRSRH